MTDKTGGPAFPVPGPTHQNDQWIYASAGMDLRDYFAAKWMQGYVSNMATKEMDMETVSHIAYLMADAMIAERAK